MRAHRFAPAKGNGLIRFVTLFLAWSFLFTTALQAAEYYVRVAALTQKNSILDIKWQLDDLGYPMFYRYGKGRYLVYAGPFKRSAQAQQALVRIRKHISSSASLIGDEPPKSPMAAFKSAPVVQHNTSVLKPSRRVTIKREGNTAAPRINAVPATVTAGKVPERVHETRASAKAREFPRPEAVSTAQAFSGESEPRKSTSRPSPVREKVDREEAPEATKQDSYDFYAGLSAGAAAVRVTQTNTRGSVVLNDKPDEHDTTYGIELGYYLNDRFFSSINYDKSAYEDVEFDNLYLTLNYRFRQYDLIRPYIGLIAGYSKMAWKKSLIDSTNNDLEGYAFYNGVQLGADYLTIGPLSCFAVYRYLFSEYDTQIRTFAADAVLTHDQAQSFNFGLRYSF